VAHRSQGSGTIEKMACILSRMGLVVLLTAVTIGAAAAGTPAATKRAPAKTDSAQAAARAEQHVVQGMTYIKMKDFDNAIVEFTRAIDLMPNYAVAYANRGVAYIQQQKLNKASDDLRKAVELDPGDKSIHYNLTALYCLQGAKDRAFDSLDKALELGFNNYDALRNDPDLEGIRNEAEFRKVLEKHKIFIK
jgi:Flp pilus assembly protein TadD